MSTQSRIFLALVVAAVIARSVPGEEGGGFTLMGTYRGLGGAFAFATGPGPTQGSERLYVSYLYQNNTLDVVAIDPATGKCRVFANPAKGEYGARCMTKGPNGNMYLGTVPHAHFLELNTRSGTMVDLGQPSATEQFIWDVTFGSDGRLYGGTYPGAKLVRYDLGSGKLEDLGRMDPSEEYAHYVAGSDDGFIYAGIGTSNANIAAYEIASGEHREILPHEFQAVGQARVFRGTDGKIYGIVGPQYFRLEGWQAIPVPAGVAARPTPKNRLRDGRVASPDGHKIHLTDPSTKQVVDLPFDYPGRQLLIFRAGFGQDGALYAGTELPANLLRLDESTSTFTELGNVGTGEIYSFLPHDSKLLMAAYSTKAPLLVFDPSVPFQDKLNPELVNCAGVDPAWRPKAMINGPDGAVYVGGDTGYGKLGGTFVVWNVSQQTVVNYPNPVKDQSIVSLVRWRDLIVGGTSIGGGGGSHPTEKEAKIFIWDPASKRTVFETSPITYGTITDLIAAPNGLVYGIAGSAAFFAFDPETKAIKARIHLPPGFENPIYNAVAIGPDGNIWGLTGAGVFRIDTTTNKAEMIATAPATITGGFAIRGREIFLISNASIYRYVIPLVAH